MKSRHVIAVAAASALLAAAPAAMAAAGPPPSIHCTLAGGATIHVRTVDGDVAAVLPAGARLDGHGRVSGAAVIAEDVNGNLSPPPGHPHGPALHGTLVSATDLGGPGCEALVLPAGADVNLGGIWTGDIYLVHDANFHAAAVVMPPAPPFRTELRVQVTLVILTASGQQVVTLPAGTDIDIAGASGATLTAAGSTTGLYLLKIPAGIHLQLIGIGPEGGSLVQPTTLTLQVVGGSAAALTPTATTGTGTLTITAVPPAPAATGSVTITGVPAAPTVPVSAGATLVTTPPPGSSVASTGGTGGTGSTTPPGGTVATNTGASASTGSNGGAATQSASPPPASVAAATSSVLPKTGGDPADLPFGLGLIGLGAAFACWPLVRKIRSRT